ncbi:MAG TPA: YidB family protein [Vicinamibacteria bacterium]|jgi:uncharacterized protein YidB (DUF937 family)
MGVLDGILGNVVGSVLGGGAPQQAQNPLGDILARVGLGVPGQQGGVGQGGFGQGGFGQGGFGQGGFGQGAPGQAGMGTGASLLMAAITMLIQNGGLSRVLDSFRQNGMGGQADSWVGTGENAGLSAAQLEQALGTPALESIASQLGVAPSQAGTAMAQILPELINQFSPGGDLPPEADDLLSRGLSMLRGGGSA